MIVITQNTSLQSKTAGAFKTAAQQKSNTETCPISAASAATFFRTIAKPTATEFAIALCIEIGANLAKILCP